MPTSIFNKVRRCLIETADTLIERGIITSAEVLARVLPQVTSGLRAAGITDPSLRQLYASIYQAFRRRRSLLLVNLESQVRMEELPWVAAMDQYRREEMSDRELSKETLKEIVSLAVISFPQAILPNKLLQEFRALAKNADLTLPLVDEVAADIFMGEFSAKYTQAAKRAADLLQGTLYETYYDIDYATVKDLAEPKPRRAGFWHRSAGRDEFAKLCSERAGVSYGGWNVAKHGMIIEQQQILTTQNLAVLFAELDLIEELRGHLLALAERSFVWICSRQQTNAPTRHAELIMLKNTAYAWRQMIFYLAFLAENHVRDFFTWADQHLVQQPSCFRDRFYPAVQGLRLAAAGTFREEQKAARRFLGWTNKRHWLSQHESPLDKA